MKKLTEDEKLDNITYQEKNSILVVYNFTKELFHRCDVIAKKLGFISRNAMIRTIIKYFLNKWDYLDNRDESLIYILVKYEIGSYAGQDLINMQQRFPDMKILNNEHYDGFQHMCILIKANYRELNSIMKMFLSIREIYTYNVMII